MKKMRLVYIIITIISIIAIGGLFKLDTEGKSRYFSEDTKAAEQEYVAGLRAVLSSHYLPNAGITLTKRSDNGTEIEYTVIIHTGLKDNGDLNKDVEDISIDVDNSTINIIYS